MHQEQSVVNIESFAEFAGWLEAWSPDLRAVSADDLYRRVIAAAEDASQDPLVDLGSLLNQALLREVAARNSAMSLRVPTRLAGLMRDPEIAGLSVIADDDQSARLFGHQWSPRWIPADSFGANAIAQTPRRVDDSIPADPFVTSILGPSTYLSRAQRHAIRSILIAPPGSTLVVGLPTGSGKTSAFLIPALIANSGVSVVVVPTTALALDLERRVSELESVRSRVRHNHFAYHGGLSRDDRSAMKQRIVDGTQLVVFTSPESLATSLASALHNATRNGFLNLFAIDEAHMVTQWGDEFRPEFQSIAGLRSSLMRTALTDHAEPFRTILLSATLTQSSLETIIGLFGFPGPSELLIASTLRPEPEYWLARCADLEQLAERVVEAVTRLPRPMIVYSSTIERAVNIVHWLKDAGVKRVALFTSQTEGSRRREIINAWRGSSESPTVDVVVATSAFGLGIDLSTVRSVIHACVPETIDRYYQEIGRSGRDGNASIGLLLYVHGDLDTAQSLNSDPIIGADRAWERWNAMRLWDGSISLDQTRLQLSLKARPPGVDRDSPLNRKWNRVVLSMMARAGMLRLDSAPPPRSSPTAPQSAFEEAWRSWSHTQAVEILRGNLADESVFRDLFSSTRSQSILQAQQGLDAMKAALEPSADLSQILSAEYAVSITLGDDRTIQARPEHGCGGCPRCRELDIDPYNGHLPVPPNPTYSGPPLGGQLANMALANPSNLLVVTYPTDTDTQERARIFRTCIVATVRQGVRGIFGSEGLQNDQVFTDLATIHRRFPFVSRLEDLDLPHALHIPKIPHLVLHQRNQADEVLPDAYFRSTTGFRILMIPLDARDPEHTHETVARMRFPVLRHDAFLASL